jgi:hypothetical protein
MRHVAAYAIIAVIAIATALTAFSQTASNHTTILGVLEENPGIHYGDPNSRAVRVVFQSDSHDWLPFRSECPDHDCGNSAAPDYPSEITWTIAFDRKNLGTVVTRAAENSHQLASGQQQIVSTGPVPTIGKRTEAFVDALLYRPLIANSQRYFIDPAGWKPFAPLSDLLFVLRSGFRKSFPTLCRLDAGDNTKLQKFAYQDDDVKLAKAYRSRTGWIVAKMHLQAIDCNDVEAGFEIDDPWFVVDPTKSVALLGSGFELVDAGDYDNDGNSELVFAINRDNRGGYELFYDNFKKHALFEFGYH